MTNAFSNILYLSLSNANELLLGPSNARILSFNLISLSALIFSANPVLPLGCSDSPSVIPTAPDMFYPSTFIGLNRQSGILKLFFFSLG